MRSALAAIALLGFCAVTSARAEDRFPQRPLRLIISVPPGGAADFIGRIVATKLTEYLGQNVVIDGRPGAGGIIASEYAVRATPDGHTLMLTSSVTHGVAPVYYKKLPYDAIGDFTHISLVSALPAMMVVNADIPAKSVKELVALTKSRPGSYLFTSSGNGSVSQLLGEQFKLLTGASMTHVPYKGSGPAVVGLAAGEVHLIFDGLPALVGQIKAGRLRPLALVAARRLAGFSEVPTMGEAGVSGMEGGVWYGISGPAGIPRPVVELLARNIALAVAHPDVQARLATVGGLPMSMGPAEYLSFMLKEMRKWAEVVRLSGVATE